MELNDAIPLQWPGLDLVLRIGAASVLGLLLGLDRVHRAGVLHCDIKPSNLFLGGAAPAD